MADPLHDDDPTAEVNTPAGPVRNLTPAEYAASYATGEPHTIPGDVLAAAEAEAARIVAAREG